MKVIERSGAEAGGYVASYMGLINPGNKPGLKEVKGGNKRLMFKLKSDKGEEIAASVLWNKNDERTISTTGAVGVPAAQLFKIAEAKGIETAILWFDKQAKEAAEYGIVVNAYVRETGGFASGLRPMEGKFTVKFLRVKTRKDADEEKGRAGTPYWIYAPSVHKTNGKKSWDTDPMNRFWVQFMVVEGKRAGAILEKMYHYAIVKDEDDEWIFDAESRDGAAFKRLLTLHGIPAASLVPDKHFADPSNGLPEIEKLLIKKARPLSTEMAGGWMLDLKPPDGSGSIDTPVDIGGGGDDGQMSRLVTMVERRVRDDVDKPAWLSSGKISNSGLNWVKGHLGATCRKHEIDPHLAKLKPAEIELLIGVIKRKYPISK